MEAIAQWLKEKGKIVIPKTLDTQVFDENGKSLDRRLKTAKDEQVIQLPKVDPTMIFSDLNYSTEEQLTGRRWIDGKPIYQKSYSEQLTSSASNWVPISNVDLSDLNIDTFLKIEGWTTYTAGHLLPINGGNLQIVYNPPTNSLLSLQISMGSNYTWDVDFTILYTKTTDTASSPIKSPTQYNYSTEEKVVGTWIDGKPLYEKTIVYDGIVKTNTKIYQNESIDEIVNLSNKCFYDTLFNEWNTEITSTYNLGITARGYYLQGEVNSEYGDRITKCRCTIQYTKTTDTTTV